MKKILILGSAPDVIESKSWESNIFSEILVINNAWKIRNDWSYCIFPTDFPLNKRPKPSSNQKLISAEEYVKEQNKFGGFVYAGGTMAFTAAYWSLAKLSPDVLFFLGCDMIYEGNKTHFYGKGNPDPLREDISLRSLIAKSARLEAIASTHNCKIFNLSKKKVSNLIFRKVKIEQVKYKENFEKRNFKTNKIVKALELEKKLNYFIEDGKYWKHQKEFEISKIDKIDKLWKSSIK